MVSGVLSFIVAEVTGTHFHSHFAFLRRAVASMQKRAGNENMSGDIGDTQTLMISLHDTKQTLIINSPKQWSCQRMYPKSSSPHTKLHQTSRNPPLCLCIQPCASSYHIWRPRQLSFNSFKTELSAALPLWWLSFSHMVRQQAEPPKPSFFHSAGVHQLVEVMSRNHYTTSSDLLFPSLWRREAALSLLHNIGTLEYRNSF